MEFLDNIIDLLRETKSGVVEIILGFLYMIGLVIVKRKNSIKLKLQYDLTSYVIAMLVMMLALPYTSSRFYYDAEDFGNKKTLFELLKENNEAVARIAIIVKYMVLTTVIILSSIIRTIIENYKIGKSVES